MNTDPSNAEYLSGALHGLRGPEADALRAQVRQFEAMVASNRASESSIFTSISAQITAAKARQQ